MSWHDLVSVNKYPHLMKLLLTKNCFCRYYCVLPINYEDSDPLPVFYGSSSLFFKFLQWALVWHDTLLRQRLQSNALKVILNPTMISEFTFRPRPPILNLWRWQLFPWSSLKSYWLVKTFYLFKYGGHNVVIPYFFFFYWSTGLCLMKLSLLGTLTTL